MEIFSLWLVCLLSGNAGLAVILKFEIQQGESFLLPYQNISALSNMGLFKTISIGLNTSLALLSLWCHHKELEQLWDTKTSILHDSCFCRILRISFSVMDYQIHVLNTLLHLQQSLALYLSQCRAWPTLTGVRKCPEHFRICNQKFILLVVFERNTTLL